jgi:uncharacterized protein (DUF983 family)
VQHITTATLVWLWSRHDLNRSLFPVVTTMLILCTYKTLLMEIFVHATVSSSWVVLLVRAIFTLCLGVTTLQIYASFAQSIGIY